MFLLIKSVAPFLEKENTHSQSRVNTLIVKHPYANSLFGAHAAVINAAGTIQRLDDKVNLALADTSER